MYYKKCVHAFIDGNSGTAYQTLPWNHRGWHCGSGSKGSGNNTHIGVEMCEPACIRYTLGSKFTCPDTASAKAAVKRTYETAVELFAMLCKKYGLDPLADGVIISHKEGCARGTASNHSDPEHLWTQLGMGYTMDGFRRESGLEWTGDGSLQKKPCTASGRNGRMLLRRKVRFRTFPTPESVRIKIRDIPCLMRPERRCTKGKAAGNNPAWCTIYAVHFWQFYIPFPACIHLSAELTWHCRRRRQKKKGDGRHGITERKFL